MILTTNMILNSVKKRAFLPSSQVTLKDEDIVSFANEEINQQIIPLFTRFGSAGEEYLIKEDSITITSGTTFVNIPKRAYAGKIRDIYYIYNNQRYPLNKIQLENIFDYQITSPYPTGYYVSGNKIQLLPTTVQFSGEIRISYFHRPSELVMESQGRKVIENRLYNNTLIITSAYSEFVGGVYLDITSGENDCNLKLKNIPIAAVVGDTLQFTIGDDLSEVEVGDWVTIKNTSIVPQFLSEIHPYLVARTVLRVQQALKDPTSSITINAIIEMEGKLKQILESRTVGSTDKLINRSSFLRKNRYSTSVV